MVAIVENLIYFGNKLSLKTQSSKVKLNLCGKLTFYVTHSKMAREITGIPTKFYSKKLSGMICLK